MNIHDTLQALESGNFDFCLKSVYSHEDCSLYRSRLMSAVRAFQSEFNADDSTDIALFSAPGRTELAGNHTDHQGGHVLAGTVNADMIAVASSHQQQEINLKSEDMDMLSIDLDILHPLDPEKHTSAALLRGIAAKFSDLGYPVTGFNAFVSSDVPKASGLSSSAAFEILIGTICSAFFADSRISPVQLAQIGQYAENLYFGKPCGLMDQLTCAVGGVIAVDFKDEIPQIMPIPIDLQKEGYALCIIDTGTDHQDCTPAYASIPAEMHTIAKMFSRNRLSEISESEFISHFSGLRRTCGDRAVLRALHYFADDQRVSRQVRALQNSDFSAYLREVTASGLSSFRYLQNTIVPNTPEHQDVAVTIAICEQILDGRGAVRVHGGGFAGTVQAYIPLDFLNEFKMQLETLLGVDRCHVYQFRSIGGIQFTTEKESSHE